MLGRFRGLAGLSCALWASATVASALDGCSSEPSSSAAEATLEASDGPFAGTLMIAPNPPHVGRHQVVIVLNADNTEAQAEPLEGATVMLSPWMPAHGHGSMDVEAL